MTIRLSICTEGIQSAGERARVGRGREWGQGAPGRLIMSGNDHA